MFGGLLRARTRIGISLAEVLLSVGLLSVALLALIGQSALLANSSQKTDDRTIALDIAQTVLERHARAATMDEPPGENAKISARDDATNPYSEADEKVGGTDYSYEMYISNVTNSVSGETLGTGPTGAESQNVKLKRFEVKVVWWNGDQQQRSGYGNLEVRVSRLVKVTSVATP
jgi:Tfp pilus assembly protein PilV